MAAIAEETEQERAERLAREEEAARLAEREALAGQPAEIPPPAIAFDEFGASIPPAPGGSFLPTAGGGYTTDSPQYAAEVARAQRGSGFINADVGPGGNVITPGYDPAIAEAAQRREQDKLAAQAERFMGVQGYQEAIRNGNTPAEALALWGSKMFRGDPKGLVNLATRREPLAQTSLQPEVQVVDGVKMYRTGPNSFAQARPEISAKPPPESVAGQKILAGQITDARNVLERADKLVAEDRSDVNAVNAALRARSKLRGLEENYLRGSTQWMQSAKAPTAAAKVETAPAVSADAIREQFRAGKISREEAKKRLGALGFQ